MCVCVVYLVLAKLGALSPSVEAFALHLHSTSLAPGKGDCPLAW